jgi:hypothetical protein
MMTRLATLYRDSSRLRLSPRWDAVGADAAPLGRGESDADAYRAARAEGPCQGKDCPGGRALGRDRPATSLVREPTAALEARAHTAAAPRGARARQRRRARWFEEGS